MPGVEMNESPSEEMEARLDTVILPHPRHATKPPQYL